MKNLVFGLVIAFAATQSLSAQCACCAGSGVSGNSGISNLAKNQFNVELSGDYRNIQNGNATEEDEKLLKSLYVTSIAVKYGITDNFSVSAFLPYVFINTNSGSDHGLADMNVLGTYKIINSAKYNLGIQAGAELPTGIQRDATKFDNSPLVIGSGSVDPMFGILGNRKWDKFSINTGLNYKWTTNGYNGNYYGSLFTQNLGVNFLLKGNTLFCTTDPKMMNKEFMWTANVGYSGEWLDKIKEDGIIDPDSGHYLGFANLGTQFGFGSWEIPVNLSVPIINEVYGNQNKSGIRLRVGISKTF